ncbi:MAG: glycosyltransferase family 39 protein [Chloroflexota bacterium]|nr:glycosyltransferase family 39 protein [Chloroflexota bacterium]
MAETRLPERTRLAQALAGLQSTAKRSGPVHALRIIMFVAFALRLLLVFDGGQRYFPDEFRYYRYTIAFADTVFEGDILGGLGSLLEYRTHPGAYAATFIPAFIHRIVFELSAGKELTWREYWKDQTGDFRFSAIFFAIPSVLSIGLIYYIARRAGADELEGYIAAFLLAASNTWFIWSRHFLTYDISMLCALAALYFALRPREVDLRGGLLTGFFLFCAFWIYTNHVFLVCTIGFLYCLVLASNPRVMFARLCFVAIGASILLLPVLIYNYAVVNVDVFAGLLSQAERITQGSYEEGAILPFVYFFEAEGVISLVWLTGILLASKQARSCGPDLRRRIMLWLAALAMLYGLMALLSTGLHVIVLFGRTVRALTPFIVLICAFAFAPYVKRHGFRLTALGVAGITAVALMNFWTVISRQHHMELTRQIRAEYGEVSLSTTFTPPSRSHGFKNPVLEGARYELVNAGYYYPITQMTDLPDGEILMQVAHPFNYRPWQYVGFTPEMREMINRDGLYIWLIDKGPSVQE